MKKSYTATHSPEEIAENHKRFHAHLEASKPAVKLARDYLEGLGYKVRNKKNKKNPTNKKSPSYEVRMEYVDDGDLEYYKDGEWRRVEVKHLSGTFTSRKDWPFRNYFVMAKHAWDKADPKPDIFISFNRDFTHIATVHGSTSDEWYPHSFKDRRYLDYRQTAYCCPLDLVEFSTVDV